MRNVYRWAQMIASLLLVLSSTSCVRSLVDFGQFSHKPTEAPKPDIAPVPTVVPTSMAEITFSVSIPQALRAGESMAIGIVDEVTGLGLNPTLYAMTAVDAQHFIAKIPFPLNSIVKYRYYRQGNLPAIEDTALEQAVRYRMVQIAGPQSVDDIVASWSDSKYSGGAGRISGTVTEVSTGLPITNILVTAGGVSTLSDSLGNFVLEGLPAGTHLLVAYSLDGAYTIFQQGAVVANGMVTIAPIGLQSVSLVQVTFIAKLPEGTVSGAPVRIAGNVLQLGNTFADLQGGVSVMASRMPVLTSMPDGRYGVSVKLPVGADIRYKYTLGDGFWNAEHNRDATFLVRQLIVPAKDVVVEDTVITWQAGDSSAPILFEISVPANTPAGETISIQFNPFGWTEPMPMWPLGNNRWTYKLFSPLNMLGSFQYRYCRNDQCGSADDIQTAGPFAQGRTVSTSLLGENIQENVDSWQWYTETDAVTLVAVPVTKRPSAFWAGVELSPNYSPSWQVFLPAAMQSIKDLGSSYVVLSPTWTASASAPLIFAPLPGSDPLWLDTLQAAQLGKAQNLSVVIYATPRMLPSNMDFWKSAPKTAEWWNSWFERYRAFAIYHADLAAQSGASALVLGGDAVMPSLPGSTLADGSPSNVPADAEQRWRSILTEVHQHYSGLLLWAHPYNGKAMAVAPPFMDQFYAFYILWSAPLASNSAADLETMTQTAVTMLDVDIAPLLLSAQKGAVIAPDYPSAVGASTGCVSSGGDGCVDWRALSRPYSDVLSAELDLKGQADLYQALLQAINQREWVGGLISRGYYPPLALRDKSSSVRGKMTADLLWYWFPRMLGIK